MDSNVKIQVVEWKDQAFVAVVEAACQSLRETGMRMDTIEAAQAVQDTLRAQGYPSAIVEFHKSVDEALSGVAHWRVVRDGAAVA